MRTLAAVLTLRIAPQSSILLHFQPESGLNAPPMVKIQLGEAVMLEPSVMFAKGKEIMQTLSGE